MADLAGSSTLSVKIKRAYEPAMSEDGRRYLVDRLWPRGRSKYDLSLRAWRKELAPSAELCRWFGHEPERFAEFRDRYRAELLQNPEPLRELSEEARSTPVTLVFAAREVEHSNATVLAELLEELSARSSPVRDKRPPGQRPSSSSAPLKRPGRQSRSHQ